MKHVPSSVSELKQRFILLVLLLTFGPVVLMTAARFIDGVLAPLIPWVIAAIVVVGLYSLVIRRYRR